MHPKKVYLKESLRIGFIGFLSSVLVGTLVIILK
jgi:hypothetical protein